MEKSRENILKVFTIEDVLHPVTERSITKALEQIDREVGTELCRKCGMINRGRSVTPHFICMWCAEDVKCVKCGGEVGTRLVGDEFFSYCSECNWFIHEI